MYKVIFAIFCFMPYVSIGIKLPSQVQPWAALMAWTGFFIFSYQRGYIRRDNQFFLLTLISIACMLYVYPDADGDVMTFLRKTVVLFLSVGIISFARELRPEDLARALRFAVPVYLVFALLQYASTGAFIAATSPFVTVRDIHIGERGAASLAPEATDFGFTTAYLIMFTLLVRACINQEGKFAGFGRYLLPMAALCIVLSKSASGVMAVMVVLAAMNANLLFRSKTLLQGLTAIAVVVLGIMMIPEDVINGMRGLRVLLTALENPEFLLQTSFAHRAVHNVVGWIGFVESGGLGYGSGSFTIIGPEIYQRYGLGEAMGLTEFHKVAVFETLQVVALGVIPQLLMEFGILGLAIIVIVFWRILSSAMTYKTAVALLMLMTWIQSFPSAYPMFWLLVGLAVNPHFNEAANRIRRPKGNATAAAAPIES